MPAYVAVDAMNESPTRRALLRSTALFGITAVAGCSATGGSSRGDERDSPTPETTTTTAAPTTTTTDPTTAPPATATQTPEPPESVDAWLEDANGYDGDVRRFAPGARPTILVGDETDDGVAFAPPAIEVAPMTYVRWDWTGHGGQHNVVALDGTFDSGRSNAQSGTGYHYVFDEPGEYAYVSEPHRADGMRGAVIVKEPPSSGNEAVDEWVVDSSNFDGTIVDRTGRETATVTVGAPGNGGAFAFDPPAMEVSVDTTVHWEWTGDGGPHSIVFEDAAVSSGDLTTSPDATFEYTFEEQGTYRYACPPHERLGMKGAIVVTA
jgi:halocyanin-like protein